MAERNATTVRIDLARVKSEFARHGAGLRRESFIRFNDIDLVDVERGLFYRQPRRRNGTKPHKEWLDTRVGIADQTCQWLEAKTIDGGCAREHHSGGAVVDARSIAGRHTT